MEKHYKQIMGHRFAMAMQIDKQTWISNNDKPNDMQTTSYWWLMTIKLRICDNSA
jgi:hypothetical protein